jgi:pimeloyl-ACP methyl ester carboxylesterase
MLLKVNGIELFYEQSGQGRPIILLHGNGESHKIFDKLVNQLNHKYTVYAIDSRGHGESTKVTELDYNTMAEDIAGFIKALQLDRPILYGFSDGGIIGLIIAFRYPELLSKLVVSGANIQPDGVKKRHIIMFRIIYFLTRSRNFKMMLTQPDISEEELGRITVETMVLAGSNDMIAEKHTKQIANAIPQSTLEIIDGETHSSYVVHSEKLYGIIRLFVEEK